MKNRKGAKGGGSIRQRTDGTWEARFTYVDALGVKKRRSVYAKTQKECRQKLTSALNSVDTHTYQEPQRMTVSAWLDLWVNTYCTELKPRTVSLYKETINARITPYIGNVPLQQLTNINVQSFVNALRDKPLAPKTVRNAHGTLHRALEQAVSAHLIPYNPADKIRLPRIEKPNLRPLMDDEVSKFLVAAKGDHYEVLFVLALFSGMRQAELYWGSNGVI